MSEHRPGPRGSGRYEIMFERLAREGAGAFVPFCVLGDPTPAESLEIVRALAGAGADALELGLAFSDPVADGPVIQAADQRALAAGVRIADAWRIVEAVRAERPDLPIGLLVYANLVEARGREAFYRRAAAAGVDSVLVADVPTLEAPPWVEAALAAGVLPVLIATPGGGPTEVQAVARLSRGFTYLVSRRGVTGADRESGAGLRPVVDALRAAGAPPALVGFGISEPAHVRAVMAAGAAGAIAGSAIVAVVERHLGDQRATLTALDALVRRLRAAVSRPSST